MNLTQLLDSFYIEDNIEIKPKMKQMLDFFYNKGDKIDMQDYYDFLYHLTNHYQDEYEDKLDEIFEKYANHISTFFIPLFNLSSTKYLLLERLDIIIPYLKYNELEIIKKKIGYIQKTMYRCNKKDYDYDYYQEICKEQLQEIELQKTEIIKGGVKMIKPYLVNNDENIIKVIFDYF